MRLVFVHGWSVTDTGTYGSLPRILAERAASHGLSLELIDIHLGRYISFRDEVRMGDVVRALHQALLDTLPAGGGKILPFSCITHSTGGPVVRSWIDRYYGASRLAQCPLEHLVMLAPANHGSALAILGSARIGRLKSWFQGVQPGIAILRWLELGSDEGRELNQAWLEYNPRGTGVRFRPFVLTGDTIDPKLYDYVNSYTGEAGSDGVVRAAAANLNYCWITLRQEAGEPLAVARDGVAGRLVIEGRTRQSASTPFRVVPDAAHSGDRIGIMRSPSPQDAEQKPVVGAILEALSVTSKRAYDGLVEAWEGATADWQSGRGKRRRFFQMIFRVRDDQGAAVTDYDILLLGGPEYDPDKLPKGFFVDKQANRHSPEAITFYLDFDAMTAVRQGKFGFRVVARPGDGFAYYTPAEFRSDAATIDEFVDPNTTLYLDILLLRHVDRETARLDPAAEGARSFKDTLPAGVRVTS